jgi:nicotinamide mononucleotide transporter
VNILTSFFENTKTYFQENRNLALKDYFNDWTLWEKFWISFASIAITVASIFTWDTTNQFASWLALISSISGIWCVFLTAKKRISNYIIGFVNVVFYAWAAYTWKLYGDFMLNAFYFLPMQFVGWHLWVKPEAKVASDEVEGGKLTPVLRMVVGAVSVIGVYLYGKILTALGGNTPYIDSLTTVFSVVAMVLMAKRYMEQWILWIIVDVTSTIMWLNICFNEGGMMNFGLAIMWMLWTVNATWGYLKWRKA